MHSYTFFKDEVFEKSNKQGKQTKVTVKPYEKIRKDLH